MATFIILLLFLLVIIAINIKPKVDFHSHWSHLLPSFKFSSKNFYELLEKEMSSHDIKDLSFEEVSLKTGNIFSSERIYLRVRWQEYYYDVCFAPFGDGCFVSWWLFFETSNGEMIVEKIPFIGRALRRAFYKKTFYQIDTASMFMTYAHQSVLSIIEEITKETGTRITEMDRKPVMNNIFMR